MRRYLAIVLGVVFVLGTGAVAYATPEIKLGGELLVRGWYAKNLTTIEVPPLAPRDLPIKAPSAAAYTTNGNITLDVKAAENLKGFIELETTFEADPSTGLYVWGTYDEKPAAELYFRQLWLKYGGSGLLGFPTALILGHMPIALGEKQFLRHERFGDDLALLLMEPTKELTLGLATVKLAEEEWIRGADDIDANVALATYKIDKDNVVGANLTWIRSDEATPIAVPVDKVDKLNFYNFGLHANGKIAGLSYAGEVDFQFGKVDHLPGVPKDIKFAGYGLFAKASYKLDPVNLRVSVAMGSGDDNPDDNKNKEFQTTVGSDLQGLMARLPNYTQIYERALRTAASPVNLVGIPGSQGQLLTGNTRSTGIANTTYLNLGVDAKPVKNLSLSLDGYLLRATKAWGEDTGRTTKEKDVGTEFNLTAKYDITKNLSYVVVAGAFIPGDYYKDGKTVTLLAHGLKFTF